MRPRYAIARPTARAFIVFTTLTYVAFVKDAEDTKRQRSADGGAQLVPHRMPQRSKETSQRSQAMLSQNTNLEGMTLSSSGEIIRAYMLRLAENKDF